MNLALRYTVACGRRHLETRNQAGNALWMVAGNNMTPDVWKPTKVSGHQRNAQGKTLRNDIQLVLPKKWNGKTLTELKLNQVPMVWQTVNRYGESLGLAPLSDSSKTITVAASYFPG